MNASDRAQLQRIEDKLDQLLRGSVVTTEVQFTKPLMIEVPDPKGVFVNPDTGEILAPQGLPTTIGPSRLVQEPEALADPLVTPTGRRKRVTEITDEFRTQMVAAFAGPSAGDYPSVYEVHDQIDLALAHKASTKYHDKQTYVRNWLKKAVEYQQARAPGGENTYDARQEAVLEKHRAGLGRRQIGRDG